MSNLEAAPDEVVCGADARCAGIELLSPRNVPLGGPRAMDVRRTLPQKQRSLIGAWCFLDHYGPDAVGDSGGMAVPRHPHTGLQTVSWLFTGEIEHRDSVGFHAMVRPGEVNLMTAGRGISHSEFSTPETTVLHGAQLWVALPDDARHMEPTFAHHRPEPLTGSGWAVSVFLGHLTVRNPAGLDQFSASPVKTHTELLGAEVRLEPGTSITVALNAHHEHGLLVDSGDLNLEADHVPVDHLAYLPVGTSEITLTAGTEPVLALLIGGEPLNEQILMWWNFVGRTHEEVVEYRRAWQSEIGAEGTINGTRRFGDFPTDQPAALPAPVLPSVRLRPRD